MAGSAPESGSRPGAERLAARLVVLWPFLVTAGFPAFVVVFGRRAGYLFGLALVVAATGLFARFGWLGLESTTCVECGGAVTVGRLYCPHCGSLLEEVDAPLLQAFAAFVLPVWFLLAESFLVTVVGAIEPALPLVRPFAERYRVLAFGPDGSIWWVLLATAVVPFVLTTIARVVLRTRGAQPSVSPDSPR